MNDFTHASTIQDDIDYLMDSPQFKHNLRMMQNFQNLLDYAIRIVSTSYDEQEIAINELEEFLR